MDSFLEDNNQFLAEANELLENYDEQVIREREKFMKEIEEKGKTKRINRTAEPTVHRNFDAGDSESLKSKNQRN